MAYLEDTLFAERNSGIRRNGKAVRIDVNLEGSHGKLQTLRKISSRIGESNLGARTIGAYADGKGGLKRRVVGL